LRFATCKASFNQENMMQVLSVSEVELVSGAVTSDTVYSTAVGVGMGLLGIALTITAPVWGTALLLGGSIAASGIAIQRAMED
jgi:hypothetical protein